MESNGSALARSLQHELAGEVCDDAATLVGYASDASIYEKSPRLVAYPRTPADLEAAVQWCERNRVTVLARGAGTSLAGQAVGASLVLDCSRHLDRILEINPAERWARVQPGVVLDQLNKRLQPLSLQLGPDVAPSNRATLGGMIGNNSSGIRSLVHGKMVDHVLELVAVGSDGRSVRLGDVDARSGEQGSGRLMGACLEALRLARENQDEIRRRFPRIMRRVSGYNLDALLEPRPNLAALLVGSESTLGITQEARVRLVDLPPARGQLLAVYSTTHDALQANLQLLPLGPSAVELLDQRLLEMAAAAPAYRHLLWFTTSALLPTLLIEFEGQSGSEVRAALEGAAAVLREGTPALDLVLTTDAQQQAWSWKLRKAGLPLLLSLPGELRPTAFVEDVAVDPVVLPELVRRFEELLDRFGTQAAFYAHASVGCLHIRPLLDLRDPNEVVRMRAMAEAVFELVVELGGSMSGEHGDGWSRSMFNERLFGSAVYELFRAVKRAADPHQILNPGKIVDAPSLDANLRLPAGSVASLGQQGLRYDRYASMGATAEACNGSAVCRKTDALTMCPSFMVTGDELQSPRGRANLVRAWTAGRLGAEPQALEELRRSFDLCVECKACKTECPSAVDVARLKMDVLQRCNESHGLSLRSRLFSRVAEVAGLGGLLAWTAPVLRHPWVRTLLERGLGLDARRELPLPAPSSFTAELIRLRPDGVIDRYDRGQSTLRHVALYPDTFTEIYQPAVGFAALAVLEALPKTLVQVLPAVCCGRPLLSQGRLKAAHEQARIVLETLTLLAADGYAIVSCEPTCVAAVRDDYRALLPDELVELPAARTWLLEELVVALARSGELPDDFFAPMKARVLLHVHCQQKALPPQRSPLPHDPWGEADGEPRSRGFERPVEKAAPLLDAAAIALEALRLVPGLEVELVDSGCCGGAGAFGYEREHYEVSQAMGERMLFPAVRGRDAKAMVVATGFSCRQQLAHATGVRALHPAQVLARALSPAFLRP